MLTVKMIVHYRRAAVGESPLFNRQGVVADTNIKLLLPLIHMSSLAAGNK